MKYGAMNFPVNPVLDEIEALAGLGFDYLELTMDPPQAHHTIIRQQKTEILQALEKYSMPLVCHLPTFVYTADLATGIRNASLSEVLNSLEAAAEIGAQKVVLHPSIISGLGYLVMDTAKKLALESLGEIVKKAEKYNITLCFENMFPTYKYLYKPEEFDEIFERFPTLRMTMDTGHAHIDVDGGKRILEFIKRFSHRISHVHFSDNKGKRDEHLPVGSGTIPFPKIVNALKDIGYDDTITLEVFTKDRIHLKHSREKVAEMFKSC